MEVLCGVVYFKNHVISGLTLDVSGAGNFGSVMRGHYRRNGQSIPVAIKTLKQDDIHNAEVRF